MTEKTAQKPMKFNVSDECAKKKLRCKTLVIQVHGAKYRTTFTKKFENRKPWIKPDPNQILSYIPGTVKDIFVREGDCVKKGDKLLILEAMKMLNAIEIPHDGTIKKIHIKPEDKIPKGFLMVEME